jgi:cyclophilin family peptidyl-prolyl cis-trans isomerase
MQLWRWLRAGVVLVCAFLLCGESARAACPVANPEGRDRVELDTVLGDLCLEMLGGPGEAPETVANFLRYVARGDYDQSFIHRSIPGFVIQGGGYTWTPQEGYLEIEEDPPVPNEPGISNLRGTVAMAKLGNDPNSATSQWFINLVNNQALDGSNGGFTVFARVVDEDLPVVDAIADLHTESGQLAVASPLAFPAFSNLPVLELLERDPAGYGCLIVFPDPLSDPGLPNFGAQTDTSACMGSQAALDEAVQLTIAVMDPQVPERLVMIERAVPEPGAPLQLALGALLLAAAASARGRQTRT